MQMSNGFGKAYLRLLVDEIRLEGNQLTISGSYAELGHAFGMLEKLRLGEVPSLVPVWRARQDSNPRPLGSYSEIRNVRLSSSILREAESLL